MADEGKGKRLLKAAGATAGGVAVHRAVGALGRRAEEKQSSALRRERVQVEADRVAKQGPRKAPAQRPSEKNLTGKMGPRQSKDFRELAQKKRISAGAQKARARTLKAGSKAFGSVGLAIQAPGAVETARAVEAEGGPFAARFGKFVERILGTAPSQHLPRPPTERERTIQY